MTTKRTYSLEQAKALFPHRFTMEHAPSWAKAPAPNGKFYAPQYRTDQAMRAPIPWETEGDEHVFRHEGKLRARVNWTGTHWRGTVFTFWGSSSATGFTFTEAIHFCQELAE